MAKEDITAALQALDIISSGFVEARKMDLQSEQMKTERMFRADEAAAQRAHDADMLNLRNENDRNNAIFQNKLTLHNEMFQQLFNKKDELAKTGVIYDGLSSEKAQQMFQSVLEPDFKDIEQLSNNLTMIQNEISILDDNITAFNAGAKLGALADYKQYGNEDGMLQPEEIDAYIEQNRDSIAGHLKTKHTENAFRKGLASMSLGAVERQQLQTSKVQQAGAEATIVAQEISSIGALEDQGRFKLSVNVNTPGEEIEERQGFVGHQSKLIYDTWAGAGAETLNNWANQSSVSYLDQAQGIPDASDLNAWVDFAQAEAHDLAMEHFADFGLTLKDVEDKTDQYIDFENKYLTIVEKGLAANENYSYKTLDKLQSARLAEDEQIKKSYESQYKEINSVVTNLKSIIGQTTEDGFVFNTDLDSITDQLAAKDIMKPNGAKYSDEEVQSVLNFIMSMPDNAPLFALNLLEQDTYKGTDTKVMMDIMSQIPGAQEFLKHTMNLREQVSGGRGSIFRTGYTVADKDPLLSAIQTMQGISPQKGKGR